MIPRFILSALPLLLPLYVVRFHIGPIPSTLLEISLFTLLLLWIIWQKPSRRTISAFVHSPWFWPIIVWNVAGFISVFVADNHLAALGLWRAYFFEPTLIFIMLRDLVRTDEDRRALLRSSCAIVMFVAVWAILQRAGLLPIPSPWNVAPQGIRATGPFPFPNALALFCVPFAALYISLALSKTSVIHRTWLLIAALAGLIATILAQSDGGLIALVAAGGVALLLHKRTRRFALVAAILGSIIIVAIPTTRDIAERQLFFKEWSGKVRLVMWNETWTMLRDHPLTGAGLGSFPTAIKPYHKATWMEIFQYPHNILLNLWSELGLLGIIAFGWILFVWIRYSALATRPSQLIPRYSALIVLTAFLVHGLVDVPYFKNDLALAFWILMALTVNEPSPTPLPRTPHR